MTEDNCGLLEYYKKNTNLEIRDLFKFIYQSSFGCEHLVSDYDNALKRIMIEANDCQNDDLEAIEFLDGEYCRVHLKICDSKVKLEKLCNIFINSSKAHPEGLERLEKHLDELISLVSDGLINFDKEELEKEIDNWRGLGFPPIHHSENYRKAHNPAYRVIQKKYLNEFN